MDVPSEGTRLSQSVEDNNDVSYIVNYRCENGCNGEYLAEKRTLLKSVENTRFIIVNLRRTIQTMDGHIEVVRNRVISTNGLILR